MEGNEVGSNVQRSRFFQRSARARCGYISKGKAIFLNWMTKKRPVKKKIVQMNDGINIAGKSYFKLHSHSIFFNCIFCYQIKPYSRAVFRQKENNILGTFVLFYRCFISCRKPSWKAPTRCICFFLLSDPHFHI